MGIREDQERVTIIIDQDMKDFIDTEGKKRDRSRSYMVEQAVKQWRRRLERDRKRRAEKREHYGQSNK